MVRIQPSSISVHYDDTGVGTARRRSIEPAHPPHRPPVGCTGNRQRGDRAVVCSGTEAVQGVANRDPGSPGPVGAPHHVHELRPLSMGRPTTEGEIERLLAALGLTA